MSKKLIAITGGIGSGKSTVSTMIRESGNLVLSADDIVKKLYKKRRFVLKIKEIFPLAVRGKVFFHVDKNEIAKEVFNDKEKLAKLNGLTHKTVMDEIIFTMQKQKKTCYAEVPLLFEGGFDVLFDLVIVVNRNIDERIKSVISRSNLTKEQVLERIKNQFDYEKTDFNKEKFIVINNDGDIESLKEKVNKIIKEL